MLLISERSRTSIKIEEKIEKKKKKDRGYQLPKGQPGSRSFDRAKRLKPKCQKNTCKKGRYDHETLVMFTHE